MFFFFLLIKKQCQVGVLPLGTGNDLARVIGWGSVCDDDAHLPQLLERYEKASVKMLDRWNFFSGLSRWLLACSTTQVLLRGISFGPSNKFFPGETFPLKLRVIGSVSPLSSVPAMVHFGEKKLVDEWMMYRSQVSSRVPLWCHYFTCKYPLLSVATFNG